MTAGNPMHLKMDLERFTRKLKIRELFWETDFEDESLLRNRSNKELTCTNSELSRIIHQIEDLEPGRTHYDDNISQQERKALDNLKQDPNIVIKTSDKSGVVIMDKNFYKDKLVLSDHLQSETYQQIPTDSDDSNVIKKLNDLVKKYNNCFTEKEIDFLTNFEWKSSELYVLPKTHKCPSIMNAVRKSTERYIHIPSPTNLKHDP